MAEGDSAPDRSPEPARRAGTVAALAALAEALSGSVGAEDIAASLEEHRGLFGAASTRLALVDTRDGDLTIVPARPVAVAPDPLAVAVAPRAAGTVEPERVAVGADAAVARAVRENALVLEVGAGAVLAAPLRYEDGTSMGALEVRWIRPLAAGLPTARLVLPGVAALTSLAVQRAHLGTSMTRVAELAARLSASRTTQRAVEAILAVVPPALGGLMASVVVPRGDGRLRLHHADLPADLAAGYRNLTVAHRHPLAESFRTGKRILLPDRAAFRARYPATPDTAGAAGLTTTLAIPLIDSRGRPLAVIGLGWSALRPLRATDIALLDTVIDVCEQTLERIELAEAEHALVTRLAGRVTRVEPARPGLEVAVRYDPVLTTLNLGGDWYDVIPLPDGRVAVVVGDVVGHDVNAAVDMAQLRTVLNTLVRIGTPLTEIFPQVTALLGRSFLGTALVMVIEPAADRIRVTRAGHPSPVVMRAGQAPRSVEVPGNPPLGLVEGGATVTDLPFGPGDLIIVFTDGLVERRSATYDDGVRQLLTVLGESGAQPLEVIADALLTRLPATDDDRAFVLIRRWSASDQDSQCR